MHALRDLGKVTADLQSMPFQCESYEMRFELAPPAPLLVGFP